MKTIIDKANILVEALPYMREYYDKTHPSSSHLMTVRTIKRPLRTGEVRIKPNVSA